MIRLGGPEYGDTAPLRVKICGLREEAHVALACAEGAAYVGFVFFERSPRSVTAEQAADLCLAAEPGVAKVGLFVDAADAEIERTLAVAPLDMLQLHGQETPERVLELRRRFGVPVIKAVGIAQDADRIALDIYEGVADMVLCDAKPPRDATVPGGAGVAFDWRLLAGRTWRKPWLLAGGLTPETVLEAARLTGAGEVDVSSGVESERGRKSSEKITAFLRAARRDVAGRDAGGT